MQYITQTDGLAGIAYINPLRYTIVDNLINLMHNLVCLLIAYKYFWSLLACLAVNTCRYRDIITAFKLISYNYKITNLALSKYIK